MVSPNLKKYTGLIKNMPVKEQACFSKRNIWTQSANNCKPLRQILNRFNVNNELIVISREDLFKLAKEGISDKFVYATMIWGYPRGMSGCRSPEINDIDTIIRELQSSGNRNIKNWSESYKIFKQVKGLGLSSWTKLLYFSRFRICGNPALILDGKLIKFFGKQVLPDFDAISCITNHKAWRQYPQYLKLMSDLATELNVDAGKLELFLYTFGPILKIPR